MPDRAILIARGVFGVFVLLSVCWCFRVDRKAVNWRLGKKGGGREVEG